MAKISDEDLMQRVKVMNNQALGFANNKQGGTLLTERTNAQLFYKGEMDSFLPKITNRSGANDTLLADAVKQVKPMIASIFRDENVVAFVPRDEKDRDQAKLETDYINYVIFDQNNGYRLCETISHDALLMKSGFFYWYWEDAPDPEVQKFSNVDNHELIALFQEVQQGNLQVHDFSENEDGTHEVKLSKPQAPGKVCIKIWAPHNVCVNVGATTVKDANYMGFRAYIPRQDLIMEGYDETLVYGLEARREDETTIEYSIDQAGENQERYSNYSDNDAETVEIIYHYVKVYEKSQKKMVWYHVVTGGNNSTQLKREEVDGIPAAMITPFPIAHRFYGESLADLLFEPQMQLTALTRIMFDEAYFALNGRYEVSETDASKYTLIDIKSGIPGNPIRSRTGNAVRPLQGASLSFDPLSRIEYVRTKAEQATGILRSTTGINADAAHETASGMLAQMNMGNVRVREIAVNFAETGWRDMAIGVHRLLRQKATIHA